MFILIIFFFLRKKSVKKITKLNFKRVYNITHEGDDLYKYKSDKRDQILDQLDAIIRNKYYNMYHNAFKYISPKIKKGNIADKFKKLFKKRLDKKTNNFYKQLEKHIQEYRNKEIKYGEIAKYYNVSKDMLRKSIETDMVIKELRSNHDLKMSDDYIIWMVEDVNTIIKEHNRFPDFYEYDDPNNVEESMARFIFNDDTVSLKYFPYYALVRLYKPKKIT